MNAKYTPGPWQVGAKHPDRVFQESPSVSNRRRVAQTAPFGCDTDEADAEDFANARLIAAAPDLLEALSAALRESGCDGELCAYSWHEQARAAIAKATEDGR